MRLFSSASMQCHAVQTAGFGGDRRGVARACRAAVAAFLLAVVGGLTLAAGPAQATTFPGDNGVLGYSSEIATEPTNTGSAYEIVSKSTRGGYTTGDEYRCTVNEFTDVMPKFSKDGKIIAWLQDQNVKTMKLSEGPTGVWQCPYKMDGDPRPPADIDPDTPGTENLVTDDNLDSWLGGWSRWEYPAGTADDTHADRKAWLFFSRRVPAETGPPAKPANFEVFKAQVDKDGVLVTGTEENVTNYPADPLTPTVAVTDSQPALCPDGSKLLWTSNRINSLGGTDIWEQSLDASYDLTGSAANRGENTAKEESAAAYKPADCTRIAFQSDRHTGTGTPTPPRNLEIYRTDATSPTTVKRLTHNGPTLPTNAGLTDVTGYDVTPQWSPDANWICFHSGRATDEPQWMLTAGLLVLGQWEVYTVDAVNGEPPNTGGSAAERETWREFNDERCGWQEAP